MKRPEIVWIWRTLARTPPAYCYHNFCANFGKSASCSANTLLHVYSLPQDGTPQPKFFKKEEKRVTIRLMGNQLVVVVDGKVQDSAAVGTHNPVRCTRRQTSRIGFVELAGCCKQCVARPFLQRVCLVNKRPHDVYPLQSVSYIVFTTIPYIVLVSGLKFPSFFFLLRLRFYHELSTVQHLRRIKQSVAEISFCVLVYTSKQLSASE
jgi:hypothetical protein